MKIAIVAIARLENDYINEWIQHHLNIGVNHIFVYDNSSDNEEKLCNGIFDKFSNDVTIIPAYNKKQYQMPAYKEAYYKFGKDYDYLIYIDIDEFIMLQKDENINDFVNRFPSDLECYRMNWELYGDSEIINRDITRSVVQDFTKPAIKQRNTTTKSIIKTKLDNVDFISVHYAIKNINGKYNNLKTYYGNMIDITSELPIKVKSLNIYKCDYSLVKLNHYITKSISEFIMQKMRREDAAWNYERNIDRDFFTYNKKTEDKVKFYNLSQKEISYFYWTPIKKLNFENAGDYYNKVLMDKIYYCKCRPITNNDKHIYNNIDITLCGSILTNPQVCRIKYIVGCGFQNKKRPVNRNGNSYLAVRGKLSKLRLNSHSIKLYDNIKFVDPGLLVSKIYNIGDVEKKYDIGIIPHYVDEELITNKYKNSKYSIISMETTDISGICRKIKECKMILSSSLHGIIFAHSLGVPAYHIEINTLQLGDNFKFKDYYSCYDRKIEYLNFKCKNGVIPFDKIIEKNNNSNLYNPTYNEILGKQKEFLSVLPYREFINKKYQSSEYVSLPTKSNDVVKNDNVETVQSIKTTSTNTKIQERIKRLRQLRSDILNGRVIKAVTPDGFVWKPVK